MLNPWHAWWVGVILALDLLHVWNYVVIRDHTFPHFLDLLGYSVRRIDAHRISILENLRLSPDKEPSIKCIRRGQ